MRLEQSIERIREVYQEGRRLSNPQKEATQEINKIFNDLRALMEDNYDLGDQSLRALYREISSDRLDKFANNLSYTDSTELVREEVEHLHSTDAIELVCKDGGVISLCAPVKRMDMPFSRLQQSNIHQYIMVNVLDWLYNLLKSNAPTLGVAELKMFLEAYDELNVTSLFYNKQLFEQRISVGSSSLKTITKMMSKVIRVFLKEKTKLQLQLARIKELDEKNAQASMQSSFVMNQLTADNAVYFNQIMLGGSSISETGDGWICGDCRSQWETSDPIISIGSRVFTAQMTRPDIRGSIRTEICQCEKCKKYNILPGILLTVLEDMLVLTNSEMPSDWHKSRASAQVFVGIGQGLIEKTLDEIQQRRQTSESVDLRELYEEESSCMPIFQNVKHDSNTSLLKLEDYQEETQKLLNSALKRVDASYIDYNTALVAARKPDEEEEISKEQQELLGYFKPTYGDRLQVREDGYLRLKPSKLFIRFAGLATSNWAQLGYTSEDALLSIITCDAYHKKMIEYSNMVHLKKSVEKLLMYLDNIGFFLGVKFLISIDKLTSLYRGMMRMPITIYDCLGAAYPIIRDIGSGLNLSPITQQNSDIFDTEAQRGRLLSELKDLKLEPELAEACEKEIDQFCERFEQSEYGRLQIMQTAKTLLLKVYCKIVLEHLDSSLLDLRKQFLREISNDLAVKKIPIRLNQDDILYDSPIFAIDDAFKEEILDVAYYKCLKDTLAAAGILGLLAVSCGEKAKPTCQNFIGRFARGICRVQNDVAEQMMFYAWMEANILQATGDKKSIIDGWLLPRIDKPITKRVLTLDEWSQLETISPVELVTSMICDAINVMTTHESFTGATYIDSKLLTEFSDSTQEDLAADRLLAAVMSLPEISEQLREDTMGYIRYRWRNKLHFDMTLGTHWSIWDTEAEQEDLDTSRDDTIGTRRLEVLDNLILFFGDHLTSGMRNIISNDRDILDHE